MNILEDGWEDLRVITTDDSWIVSHKEDAEWLLEEARRLLKIEQENTYREIEWTYLRDLLVLAKANEFDSWEREECTFCGGFKYHKNWCERPSIFNYFERKLIMLRTGIHE